MADLHDNPLRHVAEASPEVKAAINARFYPALAGLALLVAVLTAGSALTLKLPPESELMRLGVPVDEVGEVVWSRSGSNERARHMGYALFLAGERSEVRQRLRTLGGKDDWLPFHADLKLDGDQIAEWDALTPTRMDVTTHQGWIVGLAHDGRELLATRTWDQAVARKRMERWWIAGGALLVALAVGLLGMHPWSRVR
jgi:hypothetical protein